MPRKNVNMEGGLFEGLFGKKAKKEEERKMAEEKIAAQQREEERARARENEAQVQRHIAAKIQAENIEGAKKLTTAPKLHEKTIISCIFGHADIFDNRETFKNRGYAVQHFVSRAENILNSIYNPNSINNFEFKVFGEVRGHGIYENKFKESFVDVFKGFIPNELLINKVATKYGLFCVQVTNIINRDTFLYVWLPQNDNTINESLIMTYDAKEISSLGVENLIEKTLLYEYVSLYSTYINPSDKPPKIHKIFKQIEYEALTTAIAEKIKEALQPPVRTDAVASSPAGGGRYISKTLKELQAIAKARELPFSGLKKAELIALLRKR